MDVRTAQAACARAELGCEQTEHEWVGGDLRRGRAVQLMGKLKCGLTDDFWTALAQAEVLEVKQSLKVVPLTWQYQFAAPVLRKYARSTEAQRRYRYRCQEMPAWMARRMSCLGFPHPSMRLRGRCVVLYMVRTRRIDCNPALSWACYLSRTLGRPLVVVASPQTSDDIDRLVNVQQLLHLKIGAPLYVFPGLASVSVVHLMAEIGDAHIVLLDSHRAPLSGISEVAEMRSLAVFVIESSMLIQSSILSGELNVLSNVSAFHDFMGRYMASLEIDEVIAISQAMIEEVLPDAVQIHAEKKVKDLEAAIGFSITVSPTAESGCTQQNNYLVLITSAVVHLEEEAWSEVLRLVATGEIALEQVWVYLSLPQFQQHTSTLKSRFADLSALEYSFQLSVVHGHPLDLERASVIAKLGFPENSSASGDKSDECLTSVDALPWTILLDGGSDSTVHNESTRILHKSGFLSPGLLRSLAFAVKRSFFDDEELAIAALLRIWFVKAVNIADDRWLIDAPTTWRMFIALYQA